MTEIMTFTLIAIVLVVSPGPNSVLVFKTAGAKGKKASIENIVGLVVATFFHGLVSILGLSTIILQSAELFMLIKYIGAAYLLYLGVKTILSTTSQRPAKNNNSSSDDINKAPSRLNFIEGFLTQILNPKVSMFYLAAFPQFISFESPNYYSTAFLLVVIHALTVFLWFLGVTVFIQKLKAISKSKALGIWFQRFSGGLLVYFAGVLVTQELKK